MIIAVVVSLVIGIVAGASLMSICAVKAYDKGYKDGREGV